MSLKRHKQDWEDLGTVDPLWAIHSQPNGKFGKWDINEFFMTGDQDVKAVMETAVQLGYPHKRDLALDFGCGVGRLTRALAKYFQQCYGLDISESMIVRARELNQCVPICKFLVNTEEHLQIFPSNHFDIIYTKWVLQHLPTESAIKSYISEFMRTLTVNGLLVFQIRTYLPFKVRLRPGRKLYILLRALGLGEKFLYERMNLNPMRMISIPADEVMRLLNTLGAQVLEVQPYTVASGQGATYYVTKVQHDA